MFSTVCFYDGTEKPAIKMKVPTVSTMRMMDVLTGHCFLFVAPPPRVTATSLAAVVVVAVPTAATWWDMSCRVVPFFRGPGRDASSVDPLIAELLLEEMVARPSWAAALVEAEAQGRLLFGSTAEMVQVGGLGTGGGGYDVPKGIVRGVVLGVGAGSRPEGGAFGS